MGVFDRKEPENIEIALGVTIRGTPSFDGEGVWMEVAPGKQKLFRKEALAKHFAKDRCNSNAGRSHFQIMKRMVRREGDYEHLRLPGDPPLNLDGPPAVQERLAVEKAEENFARMGLKGMKAKAEWTQ